MSQIKHITFFTQAGGTQTLALQDYDSETDLEYWDSNDKALSGKLRQNMRGARGTYRISYEHCLEPDKYRTLLNNIMTDLTGGQDDITISEGSSLDVTRVVVPTDQFRQQLKYMDTISTYVPDMEFKESNLGSTAGGWVETGWVEPAWVEVG